MSIEIAPGIHRIESALGKRMMFQYVLAGRDRIVLVDGGIARTPDEIVIPYLERNHLEPSLVVVSHADVDHCGGNRRLRERYPHALFACHELDRRWIESNETMLRENYMWHEPHRFPQPDTDEQRQLVTDLGGDAPIDLGLRGDETLRLEDDWRLNLLHLPGHTPGHLGIWDPRSHTAIIIDAVLADGVYDRTGTKLIPPRYYDLDATRQTIHQLLGLQPQLLLTAHYEPLRADEVRNWLEHSLRFVDDLERTIRDAIAAGTTDLWKLTQHADARLGPYPEFKTELGAAARAVVNSS
jgi:glyoxylase-like metal-dependent hydrolase (beta-lactamase superfamily II)